jgi:hypothetical protein
MKLINIQVATIRSLEEIILHNIDLRRLLDLANKALAIGEGRKLKIII